MTVDSKEDVGCASERRRNVCFTGVLVGLLTRGVLAYEVTESRQVWSISGAGEKFSWYDEGVSVHHFRNGNARVILGSGSESEHYPWKLGSPRSISTAGHQRSFQRSMHSFDQTISFRIVGRRQMMCGAEELRQG